MKFGKKRSSPEPEPVDITHRLSILELRTSARAAAPAAAAPAAAASTAAPAQPSAAPTATAASERPAPAPAALAPAPLPVAPEPAPHVPAPAAEVAQPAPTPVLAMPDAAAYEMAAFELSSLPPVATAPPAPEPAAEDTPEPVIEAVAEHTPEPVIEPVAEDTREPVADAPPPAWSYEQVARIENAEHHVTAWVQPGASGQPEAVEQEPALHPVAAWEQASPEELMEPVAEAAVEQVSPVAQSTGWGVPAEPDPAPEPDRHPVAEWETPGAVATPESHDLPAAEVPDQRVEEPAASVDLTGPPAEGSPAVDLTEQVEHDPVYASVEAAARLEQPRDDDGVVRWRW